MHLDEHEYDDAEHADQQQHRAKDIERVPVLRRVRREAPDTGRRYGRGCERDEHSPGTPQAVTVDEQRAVRERRKQRGHDRQRLPARQGYDGTREVVLRRAVGIEDAPVGADLAFDIALPGLIERLHEEVLVAAAIGTLEKAPEKRRCIGPRGNGVVAHAAVARPPDFADDNRLVGKRRLEQIHARQNVVHGLIDGDAFPVRQQMHGDEIDMVGELGILNPDMPGLGRADGNGCILPRLVEQRHQRVHRQRFGQHRLIADDRALRAAGIHGDFAQSRNARFVAARIAEELDAQRDVETVPRGHVRDRAVHAVKGIDAYRARRARHQCEIGIDLRGTGLLTTRRRLIAL